MFVDVYAASAQNETKQVSQFTSRNNSWLFVKFNSKRTHMTNCCLKSIPSELLTFVSFLIIKFEVKPRMTEESFSIRTCSMHLFTQYVWDMMLVCARVVVTMMMAVHVAGRVLLFTQCCCWRCGSDDQWPCNLTCSSLPCYLLINSVRCEGQDRMHLSLILRLSMYIMFNHVVRCTLYFLIG